MNTPKIGEHWPEQNGLYAGIARGFDGEPDGHIVLLDDMPPENEMNWVAAMTWATGLGNGAKLPDKFEMGLLGANISDKLSPEGFYWSESAYVTTHAWVQYWNSSYPVYQSLDYKTNAYYVRAIRRIPVEIN